MKNFILFIGLILVLNIGVACKEKGAIEKAGEKIDNAIEKAGDKIEDATDKH